MRNILLVLLLIIILVWASADSPQQKQEVIDKGREVKEIIIDLDNEITEVYDKSSNLVFNQLENEKNWEII